MDTYKAFPTQRDDYLYMCEGGTETEFMYKHGFELPHFATFPLLENPKAASVMRDMYRSYLDVKPAMVCRRLWGDWTTGQVLIGVHCLAILQRALPKRISTHWIFLET